MKCVMGVSITEQLLGHGDGFRCVVYFVTLKDIFTDKASAEAPSLMRRASSEWIVSFAMLCVYQLVRKQRPLHKPDHRVQALELCFSERGVDDRRGEVDREAVMDPVAALFVGKEAA